MPDIRCTAPKDWSPRGADAMSCARAALCGPAVPRARTVARGSAARPYIAAHIAGFFAAINVPRPGQNARQCARECTVGRTAGGGLYISPRNVLPGPFSPLQRISGCIARDIAPASRQKASQCTLRCTAARGVGPREHAGRCHPARNRPAAARFSSDGTARRPHSPPRDTIRRTRARGTAPAPQVVRPYARSDPSPVQLAYQRASERSISAIKALICLR